MFGEIRLSTGFSVVGGGWEPLCRVYCSAQIAWEVFTALGGFGVGSWESWMIGFRTQNPKP